MNHRRLTTLLCIFVLSMFLSACGANAQAQVQATPTTDPAAPVPTPVARAGDRIVAEGEVTPVQYTFVNFSIQGTVAEVLFIEGDTVQSGQVLARLRGSARMQADIVAAETELLSARQDLDAITRNANMARADVQLRIAQTNKALDKAKEERESKKYRRAGQSVVDNAQAQAILAADAYKTAEENWQPFADKDENDLNRASALTDLSKARQELDRANANLNYVKGNPDEFDIAIADAELAVAQARYDSALADWELVKNGPNQDDIALAEARIANATASLDAAKAALVDQELVAPISGIIITNELKVGELAGPASAAVLIADLSAFEVRTTDLTELSVVDVQPGTPVTVSFDAVPDLEIPGKVTRIKALGEDKQGDVTYTVFIELAQQDARLRWKMTSSIVFDIKP